jgi:arylsulfatase
MIRPRRLNPRLDQEDYHLTEDLADKTMEWIARQKVSAPEKPFLCYFAPAAVHAPHHVAPEWSDKFKGQFDQGWDKLRRDTYERQLALGVIPPGTALTVRPEEVPAWEEYPDNYKPVAARLMEVFAGFMAHTNAQVERIIDKLVDTGIFDNTVVIYLRGDNGASAEGTVHGAWSGRLSRMACTRARNGCWNTWKTLARIAARTTSMSAGPGLWIHRSSG